MKKDFLEIGKITAPHGLRGEVRVQPWCDTPDFLCSFDTLYRFDGTPIDVLSARVHKDMCILRLRGIETAEAALTLRGTVLFMNRADVHLADGVYFIQDLLGIRVVDSTTGADYGVIDDVLQTGANDVYVVQTADRRYMIPAIPDVVISTDLEQGVMKIHPLEGLFDDAD